MVPKFAKEIRNSLIFKINTHDSKLAILLRNVTLLVLSPQDLWFAFGNCKDRGRWQSLDSPGHLGRIVSRCGGEGWSLTRV